MSPLIFLLCAVGISAVGVALLVLRDREPGGFDHTMESFQREMRALDPSNRRSPSDHWSRRHEADPHPDHDDVRG
jgi:hypothetical protein